MVESYERGITTLSKAKSSSEWRINQLASSKADAIDYATFFKVKFNADKLMPAPSAEVLADAKARSLKASQAKAAKTKKLNEERKAWVAEKVELFLANKEDLPWNCRDLTEEQKALVEAHRPVFDAARLEQWRNGADIRINDGLDRTAFLRIKGDTIQTSKGAEFPVKHGKLAFKVIKNAIDTKQEWHTNGHKVHLGHFQIDTITPNGDVLAGCHLVKYAEVELIAKQLELI